MGSVPCQWLLKDNARVLNWVLFGLNSCELIEEKE